MSALLRHPCCWDNDWTAGLVMNIYPHFTVSLGDGRGLMTIRSVSQIYIPGSGGRSGGGAEV